MMINKINTEIRFAGLKRSGNHAISNWILKQLGGNVLYFNNTLPENPFDPISLQQGQNLERKNFDYVLYSFEDRSLHALSHGKIYPNRQKETSPQVSSRIDVIVLRDPFNLMASRFKWGVTSARKASAPTGMSIPELWIMYAKEFLGETNFLKNKKVLINYNCWCVSLSYREQIARQLGIDFNDAGFAEVTAYGGGSSFDGTDFSANSAEMKIFDRWQSVRNNPAYIELFKDQELLLYCLKIFKIKDDLKQFIQKELMLKTSTRASIKRKVSHEIFSPCVAFFRNFLFMRKFYRRHIRKIYLSQFDGDKMPR